MENIKKPFNKNNLGGWSICDKMFEWILENIPEESTILELGSGRGTIELARYYKVISIENDKKWVGVSKKSEYIHAPLVDGWYDVSKLEKHLPKEYDLLIIDGPIGESRKHFLKHYSLFKTDIPIIIDDTNRKEDAIMAHKLNEILNKKIEEFECVDKKFLILI